MVGVHFGFSRLDASLVNRQTLFLMLASNHNWLDYPRPRFFLAYSAIPGYVLYFHFMNTPFEIYNARNNGAALLRSSPKGCIDCACYRATASYEPNVDLYIISPYPPITDPIITNKPLTTIENIKYLLYRRSI